MANQLFVATVLVSAGAFLMGVLFQLGPEIGYTPVN